MNCLDIFRKIPLLWLVIGMCGLLYPNNTGAFSAKTIDFDRFEPVEVNALIAEVNRAEAYLIVGEKKIYLMEFKVGNTLYKTTLVDVKGNALQLNSFRKGQRVLVRGIKLPDGGIAAGVVQKLSPR